MALEGVNEDTGLYVLSNSLRIRKVENCTRIGNVPPLVRNLAKSPLGNLVPLLVSRVPFLNPGLMK